MNTREKLIDARISMRGLADELKNISKACKVAAISRSHYYESKEAFERYGRESLVPTPRRAPRMPNQTPPEAEVRVLELTKDYPTTSYVKLADQLKADRGAGVGRRGAGQLGAAGPADPIPAAVVGGTGGRRAGAR